jgi:hypothetical protein
MLDQSNLSVQRCRFIFWVECSVGGYLALAKTIENVQNEFYYSLGYCQDVQGQHFEHLL